MSLRALKTFLAIHRYGSFAAASNKLGLTQAAVSLQIKKLEDEFECELFDRSGHKPILNTRGKTLLAEAEEIVSHYEQLKGILHQDKSFSGPLVIGSINTVQVFPLPQVLSEIQEDHPHLQVIIKSGLSAELTLAVELGQMDFAIVTQPQTVLPASLRFQAYCEEHFYAIAPLSFREDELKPLLEKHPYVCFDRQAWAGRMVEKRLKEEGINTRETMELDSLEATLHMAQSSLGVTIASLNRRRLKELEGKMKIIPFGEPPFYRNIGLVSKNDTRWREVVALFHERLQHHSSA